MKKQDDTKQDAQRVPGVVRIPKDSNKMLLPLFYILPREIVEKRPAYLQIPRSPHDVLFTDQYDALVDADVFVELIIDGLAWTIWSMFDVPDKNGDHQPMSASFHSFSGDFPVWELAYSAIGLLHQKLADNGMSIRNLAMHRRANEIPYPTWQDYVNFIGTVVPQIVEEQHWQPIIDDAWRNRMAEDFNQIFTSHDKIDHYRRWYHTDTKVGQMQSLEQLQAAGIGDDTLFEERMIEKIHAAQLIDSLPETDRRIMQLKKQGLTNQEIADQVGLKTHSAVGKRLKSIAQRLLSASEEE